MVKNFVFGLAGVVTGAVISWFVTTYFLSQFMLYGTYIKEAADAKQSLWAISALKNGDTKKAIDLLELRVNASKTTLEACEKDLCKDGSYPEVQETLQLIAEYRLKASTPLEP